MKIIYLANVRMPTEKAHGVQIMKTCEAFSNQGIKVKLVVPKRKNQIKENIWEYYNQKPNFEIKFLKITDFMKLEIPRISFFLQSRSFLKSALSYLKKEEFDIIYSRDLFFAKNLSALNKNIFCELHSLPRSFNKNDLEKVKGVIVITQGLKDSLIKKGIDENKILVVPDGVDLEKFDIDISKKEARKKLNLPQDKKIVLYTGHLYKWKGVQILANAAKFLDKNILIVFVGGTEKDIKNFKLQYSNFKNILIVGYRYYKEIPYWLKSADVLILPNSAEEKISKEWTSPIKMFEYMSSQRPIVASDLPSLREILNENNAILVKSDSPKALAKGIEQALKNPDFSAKISVKSFEDVQKYNWSNRVKKIIDFI